MCLAAAWAPGRKDGRYPVSQDDPRVVTAKRLHQDRGLSIDQICTGCIFSTAFNEAIAELLPESA